MSKDAVNFDWIPENDSIIANSQPSIAVYQNRWCQAVIRQERGELDNEDPYVVVNLETVPALIEKLQRLMIHGALRSEESNSDVVEFPRSTRVGPGEHSEATA